MDSVIAETEAKADPNKTKPKLKLPKFFNSIVAKMSPSKLAVDAVPVKKNAMQLPSPSLSAAKNEHEENRVISIDTWQNVSTEDFERPSSAAGELIANNNQLMVAPSLLVSPNPNHLASYTLRNSTNSLAVANIGVQNNFNLSNMNGLHIGNTNVYRVPTASNGISNGGKYGAEQGNEASASAKKIDKTKSIKDLLESTLSLDESDGLKTMRILSKHMDANWRFTLRELGFTDAEIDQKCSTYLNFKDGVYEIVYQSLLQWRRKQYDATVGELCTFLWENGQKECVNELKNHLKRERTRNVSEWLSTAENDIEVASTK